MCLADNTSTRVCLEYVAGAKRVFTDSLYRHRDLEADLGQRAGGNDQYRYDVVGHDLLLRQLRDNGVNASVFSEESSDGWIRIGSAADYVVIVDPFDQSSTTARTFRMAGVAICVLDADFRFKACAIGDLNTHLVYAADEGGAYVSAMDPRQEPAVRQLEWAVTKSSPVARLSEAFIVSPGAKSKRRDYVRRSAVTARAAYWLNVDGVLNLARLAGGYIDAYLDPFIGQPVYEVVCAELVQRGGGIVTDARGARFDLRCLVEGFRQDAAQRYSIVASCTERLHNEILELLESDRKAGILH